VNKVLAVDNNPIILKFMSDFLGNRGYHVLTAADGLSALEVLKTYRPNVIFLDLIMPNIDGKKLCRIIRRNRKLKDASIIILSAVAAEEEPNYAEYGADAYIAKGPLNTMSEHILTALHQSGQGTPSQQLLGADGPIPE